MSSCTSSRTGTTPSASSLQASWPSYGGGPANTHTATGSRITAANVASLHLSWATCLASPRTASVGTSLLPGYYLPHTSDFLSFTSPVVGDGRVFIEPAFVSPRSLAGFAELVAVDERTGRVDWERRLGPEGDLSVLPVPVVDNGRVYAGDLSHLYAFSASSGALLWKFDAPGTGQAVFPNVGDGRVYFARNFDLFSLDASTGALDWTAPLWATASDSVPPAVIGPTVVIGDCFGGVQAFNTASGTTTWSVRVSSPSQLANVTSPTFGAGNLIVSNGKKLFAIDAAKGTVMWSRPEADLVQPVAFVADKGRVFAPTDPGPWQAYSAATGQEEPAFHPVNFGADQTKVPTGSNDVVFFPTVLGGMKAVDASTGRTVWTMPGNTGAPSSPTAPQDETSSAAVAGSAMVVLVGRPTGAFLALYSLR